MSSQVDSDNQLLRKRGRPAGKHRVPLSLDQRRARNAQYERERRNETAEAMAQLAEAADCEPSMSNADLLLNVIDKIQRAAQRKSIDDIDDLKRINNNLITQIEKLENRLNHDCFDKYTTPHYKPKKKIKIEFQDDIIENISSKWTSKAVTKSQVDLNIQRQSQEIAKVEWQNQFDSHTDKSYTGFKSDLYNSPILGMKTERLDAVDQTKSQYGQSRKIIHHYLHSARASDYLSHIGPSTSSQTTQNKLPSNKKQNRIQRSLLKELKKEDSSVLDLLTDNEKMLFGDIEWLTETEY